LVGTPTWAIFKPGPWTYIISGSKVTEKPLYRVGELWLGRIRGLKAVPQGEAVGRQQPDCLYWPSNPQDEGLSLKQRKTIETVELGNAKGRTAVKTEKRQAKDKEAERLVNHETERELNQP
jgi:hypothetical protein